MYGATVEAWEGRKRSVVGQVTTSPSGNVVLRIGQEERSLRQSYWEQTEHVVLTPTEAIALAREILTLAGVTDQ